MQYFLTKDEWSASEDDWEKINFEDEVGMIIKNKKDPNRILFINVIQFFFMKQSQRLMCL